MMSSQTPTTKTIAPVTTAGIPMPGPRVEAPAGLNIRPFTEADYPEAVAVVNRCFPEYPDTVEEWRHGDAHRNPKMVYQRLVAELDGRIVAVGYYSQYEGMFHPRKFGWEVSVDPELRRRGIGGAFYARLRADLASHDPITLWTDAREDHPQSMRFVEARGFVEVMREWENHLRPEDFDAERWAGHIERVEDSGIRLATYAELEREDPDFFPRLYALATEVSQDVPSPAESTKPEYEGWVERVRKNPNLIKEGYFIALDGEEYVGLSTLSRSQSADFLYTGLTGVRRDWRRRGIALALKLEAIEHCRNAAVPLVKTWNATTNTGMLGINEALGFVKQPAWIQYALELGEDEAAR